MHKDAETVLYSNRDPSEHDTPFTNLFTNVLWISIEYIPYRVFKGGNGKWTLFGKLMPEEAFRP